jgi:hypothetical protein
VRGHDVVHASTVEEAHDRLLEAAGSFTAIVTDWDFPVRHGESAIRGAGQRIVGWALGLEIPIIVASGRDAPIGWASCEWTTDWATGVGMFVDRLMGVTQ